jgi:hypothetical protein
MRRDPRGGYAQGTDRRPEAEFAQGIMRGLPVERDYERSQQMNEKIYCKDCRFCENGFCHRMPPVLVSWHKDALFPKVDDFDRCGMAERREDAGDSVFEISEIEKLKEEKHQLRVSVQFLVNEMKSFCFCHCRNGKCANFDHECYQACEFYKSIKKYDCLEGDK